jgi:hypothetical protein
MDAVPLGRALLDDLAGEMDRAEIVHYLQDYAAVTGYDVAFHQLLQAAGGGVDLRREEDRAAVVSWLRTWGCRHLRRAGDEEASALLADWWARWAAALPDRGTLVTALDPDGLAVAEEAYDALRSVPLTGPGTGGRQVEVVVGDTAAAKVLFVVRPLTFLPWDEATRLAFGWWGGGSAYAELQRLAGTALAGLAARLGVAVGELPEELGRPASTLPKLVDEFLWVRISREV